MSGLLMLLYPKSITSGQRTIFPNSVSPIVRLPSFLNSIGFFSFKNSSRTGKSYSIALSINDSRLSELFFFSSTSLQPFALCLRLRSASPAPQCSRLSLPFCSQENRIGFTELEGGPRPGGSRCRRSGTPGGR